jgi:hypothetical protein
MGAEKERTLCSHSGFSSNGLNEARISASPSASLPEHLHCFCINRFQSRPWRRASRATVRMTLMYPEAETRASKHKPEGRTWVHDAQRRGHREKNERRGRPGRQFSRHSNTQQDLQRNIELTPRLKVRCYRGITLIDVGCYMVFGSVLGAGTWFFLPRYPGSEILLDCSISYSQQGLRSAIEHMLLTQLPCLGSW